MLKNDFFFSVKQHGKYLKNIHLTNNFVFKYTLSHPCGVFLCDCLSAVDAYMCVSVCV